MPWLSSSPVGIRKHTAAPQFDVKGLEGPITHSCGWCAAEQRCDGTYDTRWHLDEFAASAVRKHSRSSWHRELTAWLCERLETLVPVEQRAAVCAVAVVCSRGRTLRDEGAAVAPRFQLQPQEVICSPMKRLLRLWNV